MDSLKIAGLGLLAAALMVLVRPQLARADEPAPPATVSEVAPLAQPDAVAVQPPDIEIADATDADAPPAPLAPPAPPAPAAAAPAALPAPAAAPAPVAAPAPPAPPATVEREIRIVVPDGPGKPGKVKIVRYREPDAAKIMAEVRPQIEQAMKQVRAAQIQLRVMLDKGELDATTEEALRKVQPKIDRAIAKATAAMRHIKIKVELTDGEQDGQKKASGTAK